MSQVSCAVLLGAADLGDAKVEMHDAYDRTKAIREATQAIKAASGDLDLESSPEENPPPLLDQLSSHDVVVPENHSGSCVTTLAHDSTPVPATTVNGIQSIQVTPPSTAIVPPPRDTTPPSTPHPTTTATTTSNHPPLADSPEHAHRTLSNVLFSLHHSHDGTSAPKTVHEGKMIFGTNGTGGSAHRRRVFATTSALTNYEADLTGKDRAKQKEAVRQFLAETVKDDWRWEWPRGDDPVTTAEPVPESPLDLLTSITEEQWKERDEWLSNGSESGDDRDLKTVKSAENQDPKTNKGSPFRFESPDGVGDIIKKSQNDRKRRRKKRLAEEMAWNKGVRCFVERRDAWTGARKVCRSPGVGMTPIRKERTSGSLSSEDGGSSTAIEQEEDSEWEWDTEILIAPPILPPENAMRASITPSAYNTIYDKVILQSLTPSCPMNLKDVTRSCVQGWKRDGEWPPKATDIPVKKKGRKMSIASLFSFEKHDESKDHEQQKVEDKSTGEKSPKSPVVGGLGQSLRKILHLRKEKDHSNTNNGHTVENANNTKAAAA